MVEFTLRRVFTNGTLENQLVTAAIIAGTVLMTLWYFVRYPDEGVIRFLLVAHSTALAILLAGIWYQHLR